MTSKETKRNPKQKFSSKNESFEEATLILYNDEIHSFDYVIESLIEVCDHDYIQAAQCTFITHYKGKCDVRHGSFNDLEPLKEALGLRGLRATIG